MSGTAEMVADEIHEVLQADSVTAKIVRMEKAALPMFAVRDRFLICTSTYGKGDVPDNAKTFYAALQEHRPNLGHVKYGLIGLGDMTYSQTFAGGGRRLDAIFTELGAQRIGECLFHDRSSGVLPESAALDWLSGWVTRFKPFLTKSS
jgi:MioC protein